MVRWCSKANTLEKVQFLDDLHGFELTNEQRGGTSKNLSSIIMQLHDFSRHSSDGDEQAIGNAQADGDAQADDSDGNAHGWGTCSVAQLKEALKANGLSQIGRTKVRKSTAHLQTDHLLPSCGIRHASLTFAPLSTSTF